MAEGAPESHPVFRVLRVASVSVPLPQTHAVLELVEAEAPHRTLELPIGLPEGAGVAAALERSRGLRPSTHELFSELLARTHVDVIAVRLVAEHDGIFHAELDTMTSKGRELFECRPSDGIILALRQAVSSPILADERLFEERAEA